MYVYDFIKKKKMLELERKSCNRRMSQACSLKIYTSPDI